MLHEPIVLGYMDDGVRKKHTVWHPDDPVLFPPGPAATRGAAEEAWPAAADRGWLRRHHFS